MLSIIKNTLKHSVIYSIGNVGIKIIGLLLIPIYTNPAYLSVELYGIFALLESLMAIIIGILPIAMGQSLTRWYWEKDDVNYHKELFFKTFSSLLIVQVAFLAIAIPIGGLISQWIFKSDVYAYPVKLTIFTASITILLQQVLHLAKVQQKSVLFAITNIFRLVITLILIIVFTVKKQRGLNGIWEAQLISTGLTLLILFPYILKNLKVTFRFPELKSMLRYGLPFTLSAMAGIILLFADRYILSIINGLEQTAIYSLAFRISNTIKIIASSSISLAIAPARMKMISNPTNLRFFSKNLTYVGFVIMFFVLIISLFSLEGLKILTRSNIYWKANSIIPILSMSIFFGILKDFSSESMLIKKDTKKISLFVIITGLVNIALNYLLIPKYDIYGAALSTLICQVLLWVFIYYYSQKLLYIPYELMKIIKLIIIGSAILFINVFISDIQIIIRLAIKTILIIAFPIILFWFGFYEKIEIETVKKAFSLWKNPKDFRANISRIIKN